MGRQGARGRSGWVPSRLFVMAQFNNQELTEQEQSEYTSLHFDISSRFKSAETSIAILRQTGPASALSAAVQQFKAFGVALAILEVCAAEGSAQTRGAVWLVNTKRDPTGGCLTLASYWKVITRACESIHRALRRIDLSTEVFRRQSQAKRSLARLARGAAAFART